MRVMHIVSLVLGARYYWFSQSRRTYFSRARSRKCFRPLESRSRHSRVRQNFPAVLKSKRLARRCATVPVPDWSNKYCQTKQNLVVRLGITVKQFALQSEGHPQFRKRNGG